MFISKLRFYKYFFVAIALLAVISVFVLRQETIKREINQTSIRELSNDEIISLWEDYLQNDLDQLSLFKSKDNQQNLIAVSTVRNPAYTYRTVHDLANAQYIIVAEFIDFGNVVGMGNGLIEIEGQKIDDTAYYIETVYSIKDYIKGNLDSISQKTNTISVLRYVGFGDYNAAQEAKSKIEIQQGNTLMFLNRDQNENIFPIEPYYGINSIDEDGNIQWNSAVIREAAKLENLTTVDSLKQLAREFEKSK